jgi:hypothetical protein
MNFFRWGSKYVLSILLSFTVNPCSSDWLTDQTPHPYKERGKFTVLSRVGGTRDENNGFYFGWMDLALRLPVLLITLKHSAIADLHTAGTVIPGIEPRWDPWPQICSMSRLLLFFFFVVPTFSKGRVGLFLICRLVFTYHTLLHLRLHSFPPPPPGIK